ncbi:hypothetical protein KB559_21965 [Paenibacillus sp. Marseille-P2973]|uniref:hypothetical protein n=1 Tax=Paenibacillus sp. Marseille-P2973 TaxID=1871032 RepID=UPI001B385F85|nr:hypothetical protein [Paenibacillus sp. Marseille-P2973]MBQ4901508.1 hypothetical protein [Paenibacillus sp. Marseille-P2973]
MRLRSKWITGILCVALMIGCYSQADIVAAKEEPPQGFIEIVDLDKNVLIKRVKFDNKLSDKMKVVLADMRLNGRSNLDFPKGILMKVPLHTRVHNEWFDDMIREAIVIFEPGQQPLVLLFNRKNQPVLFTASSDGGLLGLVKN